MNVWQRGTCFLEQKVPVYKVNGCHVHEKINFAFKIECNVHMFLNWGLSCCLRHLLAMMYGENYGPLLVECVKEARCRFQSLTTMTGCLVIIDIVREGSALWLWSWIGKRFCPILTNANLHRCDLSLKRNHDSEMVKLLPHRYQMLRFAANVDARILGRLNCRLGGPLVGRCLFVSLHPSELCNCTAQIREKSSPLCFFYQDVFSFHAIYAFTTDALAGVVHRLGCS